MLVEVVKGRRSKVGGIKILIVTSAQCACSIGVDVVDVDDDDVVGVVLLS